MKLKKSKILALGLLTFALFSCEKKTSDTVTTRGLSDTIQVVEDSAALAEKRKADQIKEKAALPKPYDETQDAEKKIKELVVQAQKENKNIILQAGGNWCIWCLRFNQYVQTTPELKEIIDQNYLYYHLNYSPKNKNEKVFASYGNPGDTYGYPVFIVLDKNGTQIHTQESGSLEQDKGYSLEKVKAFFNAWKPKA